MITLFATSGGVIKGFGELKKAFLGPLGLIVLFNVFIARIEKLELQGKKLFGGSKGTLPLLGKAFGDVGADLEVFIDLLNRGNLSTDEQERLVFAVSKRYKDLNLQLDENGRLTNESRLQVEAKIKTLRKLAKAQAIRTELEKIYGERLQFEIDTDKKINKIREESASNLLTGATLASSAIRDIDEEEQKGREARILGLQKEREEQLKGFDERENALLRVLENEEAANEAFGMADRKRQETANEIEVQGLVDVSTLKTEINAEVMESDNKVTENKKRNLLEELAAVAEFTNSMANFLGEQSAAGKAFAIATATIDAYVAANLALTDEELPTVARFALAAAAVVQGLANVKKILSVKVPGSRGAATLAGAAASTADQGGPPTFNVVGASDISQLGRTIATQRNEPVQAVVMESQVTNVQQVAARKAKNSSVFS